MRIVSSIELKGSSCDYFPPLDVRGPLTFYILVFFSRTTGPNLDVMLLRWCPSKIVSGNFAQNPRQPPMGSVWSKNWKSLKIFKATGCNEAKGQKKKPNLFQTVPVWNPPNVYHGCSCNIWVSSNISSVLIFKLCPTFRLIKHRSRYYCRYLVDIVPKLCPLIVHKMMFFGVIYYVSYIRFH